VQASDTIWDSASSTASQPPSSIRAGIDGISSLPFQERLSARMAKNYLAAVRFAQIALGLGDHRVGEMPHLESVVKGYKSSAASGSRALRLPMTLRILEQLKLVW